MLLPDALRGREDDAFVYEGCAADKSVPAAAPLLEQRAHVRPLPERGRGTVAAKGRYTVGQTDAVAVVPATLGTAKRQVIGTVTMKACLQCPFMDVSSGNLTIF